MDSSNALPNLIAKIPQMIGQLVTTIISNLPQILQSGVRILSSLMQGFRVRDPAD